MLTRWIPRLTHLEEIPLLETGSTPSTKESVSSPVCSGTEAPFLAAFRTRRRSPGYCPPQRFGTVGGEEPVCACWTGHSPSPCYRWPGKVSEKES